MFEDIVNADCEGCFLYENDCWILNKKLKEQCPCMDCINKYDVTCFCKEFKEFENKYLYD